MQVTDEKTPTVADVKRQLQVAAHELDEITGSGKDPLLIGDAGQALYRVREAIAHLEAAEKQAR